MHPSFSPHWPPGKMPGPQGATAFARARSHVVRASCPQAPMPGECKLRHAPFILTTLAAGQDARSTGCHGLRPEARSYVKSIAPPFPNCIGWALMLVSWREWLVRTPVLGCAAPRRGSRTPRRVARQACAGIWLLERLANAGGLLWQAAPCAHRRRYSFAQSTGFCLLPRLVPTPCH